MSWIQNRTVHVVGDQAIFSGASFLITILTARYLDASAFGVYSAYILGVYLAVSAISAWTIQVFQVSKDMTPKYVSFVFWWHFTILAFGALVVSVLNMRFGFFASVAPVLYGCGFVIYDFGRKLMLALNKTFSVLVMDIAISGLQIIAFLAFCFYGTRQVDDLLMWYSGVYAAGFIAIFLITKPIHFERKTAGAYILSHFNEGKWLFLTAVSQWWAGNMFVVASGLYLGSAALGALRLAQSLFGVLNVLLQTFENYFLPQTALHMKQSLDAGMSFLKSTNKKLGMAYLPLLALIFVFATPIMTIAGGTGYTDYAFVMQGLSILYAVIFFSQPLRFIIRSLQMNHHFFNAYLVSLIFSIFTSQWLLSTYGLNGVIAGLIFSQIILIAYWIIVLRITNKSAWKSFTLS